MNSPSMPIGTGIPLSNSEVWLYLAYVAGSVSSDQVTRIVAKCTGKPLGQCLLDNEDLRTIVSASNQSDSLLGALLLNYDGLPPEEKAASALEDIHHVCAAGSLESRFYGQGEVFRTSTSGRVVADSLRRLWERRKARCGWNGFLLPSRTPGEDAVLVARPPAQGVVPNPHLG